MSRKTKNINDKPLTVDYSLLALTLAWQRDVLGIDEPPIDFTDWQIAELKRDFEIQGREHTKRSRDWGMDPERALILNNMMTELVLKGLREATNE